MTVFEEIRRQYDEIDQMYAAREFQARTRGHSKKEAHWRKVREHNDQAYFLFFFTRLEYEITKWSHQIAIERQTNLKHWKVRSAWDILPNQNQPFRINFKHKVALLLEANTSDFHLVLRYYNQRNLIAHGGNFTITLAIPTAMANMERISRKIRT